jgi:hypothetical protein
MGRPSAFTQEIADAICERMAEGESVRTVCLDEGMPDRSTVHRWLADEDHKSFRDQYARACDARAEKIFEEIIEIADTSVEAEKVTTRSDGKQEVTTGDAVERSKLRVDARKWVVARLAPKKYSEKLNIEATGKDGAPLPVPVVQIYIPDNGRESK